MTLSLLISPKVPFAAKMSRLEKNQDAKNAPKTDS
jgi:hypothetical protein